MNHNGAPCYYNNINIFTSAGHDKQDKNMDSNCRSYIFNKVHKNTSDGLKMLNLNKNKNINNKNNFNNKRKNKSRSNSSIGNGI